MFEWTQDLSIGVDIIDNQHKEWIKRMDNLLNAINQGKGKQELQTMLEFMEDYGRIHFAMEERVMLQYDYPGYQAHKAAHTKFIDELNKIKSEFETLGAVSSLALLVQSKTIDWFVEHIKKVDKQWGSYLKQGEYYEGCGAVFPDKNKGDIISSPAVKESLTEKQRAEARMQYLANYDEMTGLFNRQRFMELAGEWISRNTSPGRGEKEGLASLLFINIDELKFVNNTYGNGIGDVFLFKMAKILRDTIKRAAREGIIARLGGDEFAMFLPHLGAKEGVEIAELIRKRVEEVSPIPDDFSRLSASVGIAVYPEHGNTINMLLTMADAAMRRAKDEGRNRSHLYQPEDKDLETMSSRLKQRAIIQKAIEEDRFEPWFQPILDLKGGGIHHYEALARIREGNGNILMPSAFIETAERFGLIGTIDRIIIQKVMKREAEANRNGLSCSFGVNLSGKDMGDEELLFFLKAKILETKANPDHLIFEVTETAAVSSLDRAVKFIKALKDMGCHFSLDDFGVGFTSFVYLREMGVDYIKIDGFFIRKLNENPHDQLFVRAMTDVAKGMGIKTIAEFVENTETIRLLREFDVDYAQGYAIGKPAPWEEIIKTSNLKV